MRFIYFLFLWSATTTLSAQLSAPYCFSANKKEGKPLFGFEDTIVLYVRPQQLPQNEILQDLPHTRHAWAGKKWLRISLNASKAEGRERQLWQNWAIAAQPSAKSNNMKQIDSVAYIFSPYFGVQLNQNQYKNLLRNQQNNATAANNPSAANKAQRLAVLRQDSARFVVGYAKTKSECELMQSQAKTAFDDFYALLQKNNVSPTNWQQVAATDEQINSLMVEYLAKSSPELGRKVADLTTTRVKQMAALSQAEKAYSAQYEKVAQQAAGRVDICSQALDLYNKLEAIKSEMKTLSE